MWDASTYLVRQLFYLSASSALQRREQCIRSQKVVFCGTALSAVPFHRDNVVSDLKVVSDLVGERVLVEEVVFSVNHLVPGSSPGRGANTFKGLEKN